MENLLSKNRRDDDDTEMKKKKLDTVTLLDVASLVEIPSFS